MTPPKECVSEKSSRFLRDKMRGIYHTEKQEETVIVTSRSVSECFVTSTSIKCCIDLQSAEYY